MPVPQGFHRQDACATKNLVGWASCPPQTICTGKMPVPQKILWGGHLARPKLFKILLKTGRTNSRTN
ncbi:hypothetical protein QUB10_17410, partial [Microcoleus sp. B5-D4]